MHGVSRAGTPLLTSLLAICAISILAASGCNEMRQKRSRTGVVHGAKEAPVVTVSADPDSMSITTWMLCGAFPSEPLLNAPAGGPFREGYSTDFLESVGGEEGVRPEPGLVVRAPNGEALEFFTFQWDSIYCDLTKAPFGTIIFVTAYMYCEVESPTEQSVFLHVGTNDCGQVWLNGERVIAYPKDRGAQPSQNVAQVTLNQGRNRLLMKIGQAGANWGAFAQIFGHAAHREFVEREFPEEFQVTSTETVVATGDSATLAIGNWPDWPEPLPEVTWTITQNDCTMVIPTPVPVDSTTFVVEPGDPRLVRVRVEAMHPQGQVVDGETILYVGGDETSDYYPPDARPDHLVMSLGDDARTERRLAWRTDAGTRRTLIQIVETDRPADEVSFRGRGVRTVRGDSWVAESSRGRYRAHEVTIRGLTPGTRYVYRAGSGARRGWSAAYAFEVPRAGEEETIEVAVTGGGRSDMSTWNDIITNCAEHSPDFIMNTGNMVSDGRNMDDWSRWFYEARDVFPSIPFMPAVGSLERRAPTYLNAFALPLNAPDSGLRELCYSFDYGPAHWVVLTSEYRLRDQARWLESDLSSTSLPWTIVVFHRPAYTGHPEEGEGYWQIREFWGEVLDRGGVDLAIQGHHNFYYRTEPMLDGEAAAGGVVYLTTGGAGTGTSFATGSNQPGLPYDPNPWMAAASEEGHYVLLSVSPTEIEGVVYDADGVLLDEFALRQ